MSTREYAHMIVDELTEDQLDAFVTLFRKQDGCTLPDTGYTDAEITAMLEEADESVRNGHFYTVEEVWNHLREKYGE